MSNKLQSWLSQLAFTRYMIRCVNNQFLLCLFKQSTNFEIFIFIFETLNCPHFVGLVELSTNLCFVLESYVAVLRYSRSNFVVHPLVGGGQMVTLGQQRDSPA